MKGRMEDRRWRGTFIVTNFSITFRADDTHIFKVALHPTGIFVQININFSRLFFRLAG